MIPRFSPIDDDQTTVLDKLLARRAREKEQQQRAEQQQRREEAQQRRDSEEKRLREYIGEDLLIALDAVIAPTKLSDPFCETMAANFTDPQDGAPLRIRHRSSYAYERYHHTWELTGPHDFTQELTWDSSPADRRRDDILDAISAWREHRDRHDATQQQQEERKEPPTPTKPARHCTSIYSSQAGNLGLLGVGSRVIVTMIGGTSDGGESYTNQHTGTVEDCDADWILLTPGLNLPQILIRAATVLYVKTAE